MIKNVHLIEDLEKEFISKDKLSYKQYVRMFESLWQEGLNLGILPPKDPLEGIEVDLRIANILNSCLKKSSQK